MRPALHGGGGGGSPATERPSAQGCGSAEEEMKYLWPPSSAGYEVRGKRFPLFYGANIHFPHRPGRAARRGGRQGGGAERGPGGGGLGFPS